MEKTQTPLERLRSEVERLQYQAETDWQCGYQSALNEVLHIIRSAESRSATPEVSHREILTPYMAKAAAEDLHRERTTKKTGKMTEEEWQAAERAQTSSQQTEISDEVLKKTLEDVNKQPMTFVPNEISDEEIEKATSERSINYSSGRTYPEIRHLSYANGFIEGAKWYREQLKQRR